ncbi:bifunctional diguanylate cyclase/phosphodiesterase [Aldersonia sp. NBC_00410]|uniref:putative bifunctional diguanylate cyclase/phosphodiesterase n=1 Tax=Aldersonia sp. NBC_00410 TaxID=2975954 RepID=UPI00225027B7|nr:bifunctional diguanylate cyclase/phosphodiesterase [Aldersonia sp. NBC_00410]MCX5045556.1 bifunctional diguanylate cyclase/phosphodiesterase [Aldersonia sp. NBC_00410]
MVQTPDGSQAGPADSAAAADLLAQLRASEAAVRALQHSATHDDLTGLWNRRALRAHLDERLGAGAPGPVAVLFLDIDRLKAVNDTMGHSAGDALICRLADSLVDNVEDADMVARIGGDEFVIVPHRALAADAATAEADRIRRAVTEDLHWGADSIGRGVSVGVAVETPGEVTPATALENADRAVLAAKSFGGDRVTVFCDRMRADARLAADVERDLPRALNDGSLQLHYQPEVDLRTGRVHALEALLRWHHPTRGALSPETFAPLAEATSQGARLGRWVFARACADFARWRAAGLARDVLLRVNVSPAQLVCAGFRDNVAATLSESDVPGPALCVELTEHEMVRDLPSTQATLVAVKELGVQVAIDDFGVGFSSFAQLKSLPVDGIKIDRSFVRRLGVDPSDHAIVRAATGLANGLGLHLTAEGVETTIAARALVDIGCYHAQGFLPARPMPSADVPAVLRPGALDPQRWLRR